MGDQYSSRHVVLISIIGLLVVIIKFVYSLTITDDIFIMCDIGQGDGMYARVGDVDVVIDSGRDARMAKCLGRYMRPFDRTIELAFITNSDADHFGGFGYLIRHYRINKLLIPAVADQDRDYLRLLNRFIKVQTDVDYFYTGDTVHLGDGSHIKSVWPSKQFIGLNKRECGNKNVKNLADVKILCDSINPYSQVFIFRHSKGVAVLFTGDITREELDNYIRPQLKALTEKQQLRLVLKVPHHGSRTGLTKKTIDEIDFDLAIISAGRRNRYNHPHAEIVQMLKKASVPYFVTKIHRDIHINLSTFQIKTGLGFGSSL